MEISKNPKSINSTSSSSYLSTSTSSSLTTRVAQDSLLSQKCIQLVNSIFQLVLKPSLCALFKFIYEYLLISSSSLNRTIKQVDDPIYLQSAYSLAKQIREKKLKSACVIEAYINRIKEIQPILNLVCDERFEIALEEARQLDKLIENDQLDESLKQAPLLGVPFTCKELIAVKGLNNSAGQVARKHIKASADADVVQRMRQAGAIPICVTMTSELGLWFESSNHVYGMSKNPYNTRRITGGSSGGEAALIAACGSLIGIGSDIGGSIRIPASMNGIYAHKPSNGLVSNAGAYPTVDHMQDFLLTNGPLCRYADDLECLLDTIINGDDARKKLVDYDEREFRLLDDIQLFYMDQVDAPFVSAMSSDVRARHASFINYMEHKTGRPVVRVDSSDYFYQAFEMFFTMMTYGKSNDQVCQLISTSELTTTNEHDPTRMIKHPIVELLKSLFGLSEHTLPTLALAFLEKLPINTSAEESARYLQLVDEMRAKFDKLLGRTGVLLFPAFPTTAPYHNQALLTNPLDWIVYFGYINSLGLPSTSIPLGLSPTNQMPIGMQLIANRYCDKLPLMLAKHLASQNEMVAWIQPGLPRN